jgi:hypothetical protein
MAPKKVSAAGPAIQETFKLSEEELRKEELDE